MITFKKIEKYGITVVIAVVGLWTLLQLNLERKHQQEIMMKNNSRERQLYIEELKTSRKEMTQSIKELTKSNIDINQTMRLMDYRISTLEQKNKQR